MEILVDRNLRWLGHIHRMNNNRRLRKILYSQLYKGKRNYGRPRMRFKYAAKRNKTRNNNKWQTQVKNRPVWRKLTKFCQNSHEQSQSR
uniref:Uncharacterized protein n=1 Tax=Octopus bimaculoides TaxID=37653 RepID=A0A0L8HUK4_OCTBM